LQSFILPFLQSWSTDVNLDNKADYFDFELVFPMLTGDASVTNAMLILFFDVKLSNTINTQFNAMVVAESQTGTTGNKWQLMGDLTLKQRGPFLYQHSGVREVYALQLINSSTIRTLADTDLGNLMLANEARNGKQGNTTKIASL
jgi:hypothetical protein